MQPYPHLPHSQARATSSYLFNGLHTLFPFHLFPSPEYPSLVCANPSHPSNSSGIYTTTEGQEPKFRVGGGGGGGEVEREAVSVAGSAET